MLKKLVTRRERLFCVMACIGIMLLSILTIALPHIMDGPADHFYNVLSVFLFAIGAAALPYFWSKYYSTFVKSN